MTPLDELLPYLLGEADAPTQAQIEARLKGDPSLRRDLSGLQETLGQVATVLPPLQAPGLTPGRDRLFASVDHLERLSPHAARFRELAGLTTRQARRALHFFSDEGGWLSVPVMPGVRIRGLDELGVDLPGVVLARIEAGGAIPDHLHHGPETMFVLEGELVDQQGHRIQAGGELKSEDQSKHLVSVPPGTIECCCVVLNEGWVEYLFG
jgi:anti-sigma factor ChrR (cupin superfamily)